MRIVLALFAIAACGGSPPPQKPADPPKTAKASPPMPPKELLPAPRQTHDAEPMEALPDVPPPQVSLGADCDAYIAALEKLGTCQSLAKEERDQIVSAAQQVREAFAQYAGMPDMKETMASVCQQQNQQVADYASQYGFRW